MVEPKPPSANRLLDMDYSELLADIEKFRSSSGHEHVGPQMEIQRRFSEDQISNSLKTTEAIKGLTKELGISSKSSRLHSIALLILTGALVLAAIVQAYSAYQTYGFLTSERQLQQKPQTSWQFDVDLIPSSAEKTADRKKNQFVVSPIPSPASLPSQVQQESSPESSPAPVQLPIQK